MNTERDAVVNTALDRLTPGDAEPRDWDAVLQRAARGRGFRWVWTRLVPAAGVAALSVVLAVLFVRLSGPDEGLLPATEAPPNEPLRFSVFSLPPTNLPAFGVFSPDAPAGPPGGKIDESSARLASVVGTTQVFVAQTKEGGYCIGHGSTSSGTVRSMSCGDAVIIREVGALTLGSDTMESGLVPDGVTRARIGDRAVDVENNVFLLTTRDAQSGPIELLTATGWRTVGAPGVTTEPQLAVLRRPQVESDRGSGFDGS